MKNKEYIQAVEEGVDFEDWFICECGELTKNPINDLCEDCYKSESYLNKMDKILG